MTREEKANLLNDLLEYEEKNDIGNLTRAERREFQQWISKALDQKSILDKLRAEIEQQEKWLLQAGYKAYNVDIAFDAIKHMIAESEDKE